MRTLAKAALALGFVGAMALGSSTNPASAQGFYFDAPGVHIGVGHPWHRRYYDYARPYGSGYYNYYGGGYGGGNCYYGGCCPQGMTIQGGACQPYRGPYGW